MKNFTIVFRSLVFLSKNCCFYSLFFASVLCFSCSKDLVISEESNVVKDAEQYFSSQKESLNFFTSSGLKTKSSANHLLADWDRAFVRRNDSAIYVEVPLQNQTFDIAVTDKGERLPISTRLIIEKNNFTNHYSHFIISKIWKNNLPNLSEASIGEYNDDAYTFIYHTDGELFSMFEILGGDLYPLIVEFNNNKESNSNLCIENCTIYLKKHIEKRTRVGLNIQCYECMFSSNNYICINCGLYVGGSLYKSDFFYNMIKGLQNLVSEVVRLKDSYGSGYFELLQKSGVALKRAYADMKGINKAVDDLARETNYFKTTRVLTDLIAENSYINQTIYIDGVYELYYFSPYCALSRNILGREFNLVNNLMLLYRGMEVSCEHSKCSTCGRCLYSKLVESSCNRCSCSPPCVDQKCPICGECFYDTGERNPNCTYCESPKKDLHLLQDSILKKCPSASIIFYVKDEPLRVRPFYKWESADMATDRVLRSDIGARICNSIAKFNFYESPNNACVSGDRLALPANLLLNRNNNLLATILLHELFHTKQSFTESSKANAEVEAKLAKIYFARQIGVDPASVNQDVQFFFQDLLTLYSYLDPYGNIIGAQHSDFNSLFKELAEKLGTQASYGYDETLTLEQNTKTLKQYLQ